MKKIIVALALVLVLSVQSFAFAPLAYLVAVSGIPAYAWVTSAAVHVGAGAVGLYYALKSNQKSSVDSAGTISRPASAVYIDTKDLQVTEKNLKASLPHSAVKSAANSKPTKFPNLKNAVVQSTSLAPTLFTLSDEIVSIPGYGDRKVKSVEYFPNASQNTSFAGTRQYTANWTVINGPTKANGYHDSKRINYDNVTAAFVPVERTPLNFSSYIAANGVSGDVSDLYQNELDEMMKDPDYIPTFSDATTGLPYSSPPQSDVMTPAQIAAHNTTVDAYNKKQQAAETASGAALDAQASAANAAAAYASSGGNPSTGVGGDAGLYQKYLEAKAYASGAQAASDAAQAKLAEDALDDQKKSEDTAGDIPGNEERKTLDFTPLHSLKSKLDTTYPFNLPGIVLGYYTALKSTPEAPQFDLSLPLGQTMHIDLSPFDSIAVLMRYLIGILLTSGIIYYIIHFFRGIS